jgi:hypothetical protein
VDKTRYIGFELKMRVILDILRRRNLSFAELSNNINNGVFPVITPEEWEIITETTECKSLSTQGTTTIRKNGFKK